MGDFLLCFVAFLGLLKKLGIDCSKEKTSSDRVGLIGGVDQGVFHRIHNVCEHMIQQLCSANDLMQVLFFISSPSKLS